MDNDNDLLYVHPTTLTCALTNTCLPCLYKLFPDGTIPCQEVLKLPPNQRPENCPRSQPHTTYSGLYTAAHRILTVGDGDFSFSLSLANGIQSINNTTTTSSSSSSNRGRCQLTATSHESLAQLHITYESVGIVDKLSQLHAHGVTVLHGVDATQLAATSALHQERYDVIIWNFPCVRAPKGADGQTTEIDINKQLLRDFFRNAHDYLTPHGQLHIAHKTIEPFSWWDIKSLALEQGYRHVLSLVFDRYLYPGYVNRKVLDKKSFPTSDARVFVFVSCSDRGSDTTTKNTANVPADTTTITPIPQDVPPAVQREEIARVLGVVPVELALVRLQSVVKKMLGVSKSTASTIKTPKSNTQHKDKGSTGDKRKKTGGGDRINDDGSGAGSSSGDTKKKSRVG